MIGQGCFSWETQIISKR